ncbi:MAG: hypothetical protein JJT85_04630 [Chromatiales bacterium]|nr:hypothetical protein [Chromatiales bacterium]
MTTAINRESAPTVERFSASITPEDVKTVESFVQTWPHLGTEPSHRWVLFRHRDELEAAGAIARRGRRVFIVVPRYMAWMAGQGRVR